MTQPWTSHDLTSALLVKAVMEAEACRGALLGITWQVCWGGSQAPRYRSVEHAHFPWSPYALNTLAHFWLDPVPPDAPATSPVFFGRVLTQVLSI